MMKANDNNKYYEARQEARDEMAKALEKSILNPLGLLSGLFASLKAEDDDGSVDLTTVGYLLGLVTTGARKELEIQQMGGSGAYWLQQLVEGWEKEKKEGAK